MKYKLFIKGESLIEFFAKWKYEINECRREPQSHLHLLKDVIYLSKGVGLKNGDMIKFESPDISTWSHKQLKNTHIYRVENYDSILVKLVLIDSKIEEVKDSK